MYGFKKEDFEGGGSMFGGGGVKFSVGDIKLRAWIGQNGKYCCEASFTQGLETVRCYSECKHHIAAIRSAVGKLVTCLIEGGRIAKIKDGDEWFDKAFMGEHTK